MSHAATYHTDESGDSESEQNYSDNDHRIFARFDRHTVLPQLTRLSLSVALKQKQKKLIENVMNE